MSAPCFGRPIWLVQLSLLEAPAVVRLRTPRSRISHSPSFLFHISFFFLPGRLRADRCLPGGIGAPEVCPSGGLLYFLFSVYSIQCPHCVIKSSSSISLRNARSLTVSLGICLLSH
ncbi:hypothetical protein V8G54_035291 [Vigna mungo]|uniref:Uncharacterized protein n=1 Tax=Vigna mungo TaxID=3915 RepID=A0AAQ3MEX6_VIGMU